MKGVDYSKTLSKEREYFQDAIKKNQESTKRQISDTNERTEGIIDKQRKNFIEDKAELESSYQNNMEKLNEMTRNSLANNNDEFHTERAKEREAFSQEALIKRKDFDQRLNDITKSYKKSFDSEKDIHKDLQTTTKKKYDKGLTDTRAQSEQQLRSYRDEMTGQGADLKDQYNRERQQLVRSHEDATTSVQKDSAHKRAEQKEHLRSDFQKSKEVQAADFDQQKLYYDDRMKTMQKKFDARSQNMAKDYSERSDKIVDTQQKEQVVTNRENQGHLMEARRDFNKQLRLIDLDKRRRDNGSGEFAEVMDRQQGLRDATTDDTRLKEVKDRMAEKLNIYQQKSAGDQEKFNESLRTENAEGTARLDRKLNEANADKIINVSKEREKAQVQITNRENQNRLDRHAYEQQMMVERNNSNERLTKLKENFNSSMRQLEEKHLISVEDVTKVNNKDKAEFVKKLNAGRNEETFAMKREFSRLMDQTVQDYEQRLGNFKRDNDNLKMTMDQKIQSITEQADKALESQRILSEDRRSADLKNTQVLVDQKENHWKSTLNQTNATFRKKIDKMQIENDTTVKFITNDYEGKLKEMRAQGSKDLAQKDTIKKIELDRLKTTYETEKSQLISAYETKIEDIKAGHNEQMESMKNFKRLS
jgi:hypothetical protein